MADGRETRAAIDSETVRGLLLINGGGAVALLAFLPALLPQSEFQTLSRAVIWSIFTFQFGLMCAVIHNRLRGLCSLEYAKVIANRKVCNLFSWKSENPCVCVWSRGFMWASIAAFLLAGLIMMKAGISNLDAIETNIESVPVSSPNNQIN